MTTLTVGLGDRAYDVVVGSGTSRAIADLVARSGAAKVVVVTQAAVRHHADAAAAHAEAAGAKAAVIEIGDGEEAKNWESAGAIVEALAAAGLRRDDLVLAVGGGVTTDVAGFAAASYLRGIRWIAWPTTVLGARDAAVGGKTGVNLSAGKNLAGAFWQPIGVVVDTEAFAGLPERQVRSGLAEAVKCGFIADPVILDLVDDWADCAVLEELVTRGIAVKARIVTEDERETGARAFLNYGHTFGHALETSCGYRLTHGEAISVGMVFAAALARARGTLTDADVAVHRETLGRLGLPVSAPAADVEAAAPLMSIDKKARAGGLRFVLLDGIGHPALVSGVDAAMVGAALHEITERGTDGT